MSKNDQSCIIGTPKFVSVHIHDGIDASRRDDLISVAYMYMYMLGNQHIPWENIQDNELHDELIYAENHILYYKKPDSETNQNGNEITHFRLFI